MPRGRTIIRWTLSTASGILRHEARRNGPAGLLLWPFAFVPPCMLTGTMPVAVSCSQFGRGRDGYKGRGYVTPIKMDNGAIFRTYGGAAGHDCAYSFHGTVGAMKCVRGHGYFGLEEVRVWHEPGLFEARSAGGSEILPALGGARGGSEQDRSRRRRFLRRAQICRSDSHGVQPIDAYHGITMSNVGIRMVERASGLGNSY